MTGKTHFAVGTNAVWLSLLFGPASWPLIGLAFIGGIAGLLPDIDTRKSTVNHETGGLLRIFLLDILFRHRSVTHSLLGTILAACLFVPLYRLHPLAPLIALAGFASHLFIDGFNPQGCEYLYPNKNNYRLIPKLLCVDTGGWVDHLLFFLASATFALFACHALGLVSLQSLPL